LNRIDYGDFFEIISNQNRFSAKVLIKRQLKEKIASVRMFVRFVFVREEKRAISVGYAMSNGPQLFVIITTKN
jgi:hypothetical protein